MNHLAYLLVAGVMAAMLGLAKLNDPWASSKERRKALNFFLIGSLAGLLMVLIILLRVEISLLFDMAGSL